MPPLKFWMNFLKLKMLKMILKIVATVLIIRLKALRPLLIMIL